MGSGVELWENNGGTSGGTSHCHGCMVMGLGGEEHHRRPQGRVVLLTVVGDDDDGVDVGVGMDDGGDR